MSAPATNRFGLGMSARAAAYVFALAVAGACSYSAFAQESSGLAGVLESDAAVSHVARLEQVFWVCDYVGTTRGVGAAPVGLCSAVFDELKQVRFGGDFDALLGWWRQNKPGEHEKLARSDP